MTLLPTVREQIERAAIARVEDRPARRRSVARRTGSPALLLALVAVGLPALTLGGGGAPARVRSIPAQPLAALARPGALPPDLRAPVLETAATGSGARLPVTLSRPAGLTESDALEVATRSILAPVPGGGTAGGGDGDVLAGGLWRGPAG